MRQTILGAIVLVVVVGVAWIIFDPFSGTMVDERVDQAISLPAHDHSPLVLEEKVVVFNNETEAVFRIPADFNITVAAEDLGKARFLTKSPDGRLFVPDMMNWNDNSEGKIYILEDYDAETKKFTTRHTYLSGLRNPHSLAFYQDAAGKEWIYIALTNKLVRYPYANGDTSPSGEEEVIAEFADYRTVPDGAWHVTRTIVFDDDKLYVSVGSSCDYCEEPENETRAEVIVMNPDGSDVQDFATGLRNAVGLALRDGVLYATNNGPDHLGAEAPDDGIYMLEAGKNYGFPYCYESAGESIADDSITWEREPVDCANVPKFFSILGPHTAPLGITYIGSGHPKLTDSFLVALHGSYQLLPRGYHIKRVLPDGSSEIFMDGFLLENGERTGRPVHVLQWDENTLLVSDDFNGRIFTIYAIEG